MIISLNPPKKQAFVACLNRCRNFDGSCKKKVLFVNVPVLPDSKKIFYETGFIFTPFFAVIAAPFRVTIAANKLIGKGSCCSKSCPIPSPTAFPTLYSQSVLAEGEENIDSVV